MKSSKTTKTGTTRRGFISQTGLMLAGSVLACLTPGGNEAAIASCKHWVPPRLRMSQHCARIWLRPTAFCTTKVSWMVTVMSA